MKVGASIYGTRYARGFKLRVLKDADECLQPGEIGRLLRRYGITHATLTAFRRQRASGALAPSPSSKGRSGSASPTDPSQARRVLDLERENRALKRRLTQAEAIIEVQKNVSRLLEMSFGEPERQGND
jgi:transposase-like protein